MPSGDLARMSLRERLRGRSALGCLRGLGMVDVPFHWESEGMVDLVRASFNGNPSEDLHSGFISIASPYDINLCVDQAALWGRF